MTTASSAPASTTTHPRHPRVRVLLSTYNGQQYVAEQLRSILSQLPPGGHIHVRDDGSTDRTVAIIGEMRDPRITVTPGPNLGFSASFLTLLSAVPPEVDMVMFSDQDDAWLPGKIDRAWSWLRECGDLPALYGSAQMLADAALQPLQPTKRWAHAPSFRGALAENMITGCTAALNAGAVQLLQRAGVVRGVHFHDWWLYLVVSAFGRVVFDAQPTLLYRQHGANQIGHGAGWAGRQLHIVRFLWRKDWVGILLHQLGAFWQHYGQQLSQPQQALVLHNFSIGPQHAAPRWRMIFGLSRWRDSLWTEAAFRFLLALHKLRLWPPVAQRL